MDFQGHPRDPPTGNLNAATGNTLNVGGNDFRAVRPGIPQIPFFQGFPPMGSQMPYLFPHPFLPTSSGAAYTSPTHGIPNAPIDLTEDTQKRASQECVTEQSKPTKRRRGKAKKSEIVDLDAVKEDAELLKSAGHWKDHWVIQLITIRGEMQNIFSAPPKQGIRLPSLVFSCHFCMIFFLKFAACMNWPPRIQKRLLEFATMCEFAGCNEFTVC